MKKQFTQFDRSNLDIIRKALAEKLIQVNKEMEEEYNVSVKLSTSGSFDAKEYSLKLTSTIKGVDVDKDKFMKYCEMFGLQKTDFKREFTCKGKNYRIIGVNLNSRKYPILCELIGQGKQTSFTVQYLKDCLN